MLGVGFVLGSGCGVTLAGAGVAYFYERNCRDIWRQGEVARLSGAQVGQFLESPNIGMVVSDFLGRVLAHTPSAAPFLELYSESSQLSPDLFSPLLHQASEGQTSSLPLFPPSLYQGLTVACRPTVWFTRNAALFTISDSSLWLHSISALTRIHTKVLNEIATLERDANRKFRETNDPSAQLELCRLNTVLWEVNNSLAVQRACCGLHEPVLTGFNLRTELIDAVEFGSVWAENKALVVGMTLEPGLPRDVRGDRVSICSVFKYLYSRVAEVSSKGSAVAISALVTSAAADSLRIEVAFSATSSDPEPLARDVRMVATALKQGKQISAVAAELVAFQVMLRAIRGDCSISEGLSQHVLVRCSFSVESDNNSECRLSPPVSSLIRHEVSVDHYQWDYKADLIEDSKLFVRKRYAKHNSCKINRGGMIMLKPELQPDLHTGLMPIVETNSSEQLPHTEKPPLESETIESSASEEYIPPRSASIRVPSSDMALEIPSEAVIHLLRCARPRNRCDLRHVSASQASSSESSPFESSLRSF